MAQPWIHERISADGLNRAIARHANTLQGTVLDVGAGSSPYRQILGPAARWVSIDLSSSDADVRADAHFLPVASGSIDGIVCTQVLEHLEQPLVVLKEFSRVLRPAGLLILSAPQAWTLHEVPRDFWRFTRFGLEWLFDEAGLRILNLTPTTGAIGTAAQILCSTLGKRGRHLRLIRTIVKVGAWLDLRFPDPEHPLDYVVKAEKC